MRSLTPFVSAVCSVFRLLGEIHCVCFQGGRVAGGAVCVWSLGDLHGQPGLGPHRREILRCVSRKTSVSLPNLFAFQVLTWFCHKELCFSFSMSPTNLADMKGRCTSQRLFSYALILQDPPYTPGCQKADLGVIGGSSPLHATVPAPAKGFKLSLCLQRVWICLAYLNCPCK